MKKMMFSLCLSALLLPALQSCKKELSSNQTDSETQILQSKKSTITVKKGQSIQAAVNLAQPGTTIQIEPGTYKEAVVVDKKNITITGLNGCNDDNDRYDDKPGNRSFDRNREIIIENPGSEEDGILVTSNGNGFALKNVTIKNFTENGIKLDGVDGFVLLRVTAINDGEYGLYPVHSKHGLIKFCKASGHEDTGVYVGQSTDVEIVFCEANANTNGIEIENCTDVSASKNESYDNLVGILVVLLPGLPAKELKNISVTNNDVHHNNHAMIAAPGQGFESVVPSGSGILVVGAKNTLIANNSIKHNNFTGIAVVSTVILGSLAGLPPSAFADIDPGSRNVKIVRNVLKNNGSNPPAALGLPGVDLLWLPNGDGTGTSGNCWMKNNFTSSYPSPLPVCI